MYMYMCAWNWYYMTCSQYYFAVQSQCYSAKNLTEAVCSLLVNYVPNSFLSQFNIISN